jgi:amino acid adenylation domain-containing protein
VKRKTLSCFENQSYQYEELIEELNVPRNLSRNPLFDVMFVFQNFEHKELIVPGLKLTPYSSGHSISKFDLTLTVVELKEGLHFNFEYSTDLFKAQTIERFISYLQRIVAAVIEDANKKLLQIDILSKEERDELLYDFNDTSVGYPVSKTIMDLFEDQAERTPNHIAIKYGENTMTYRDLKERSDRIAIYLQQIERVEAGDLVGLLLEREEQMLPAIFGILKSGAAYVPLSTHYPSARVNSIISGAGLKLLITRGQHIDALSIEMESGILDLDTAIEKINEQAHAQPVRKAGGNDLAYVIYTSGSTGNPKGVMIEHHSVVNRLLWMQKEYPLTDGDVLMQKTPLVFDVSVWELFWWSLVGASVCLLPPEEEKDPSKIIGAIEKYKITTVHFVPSMLSSFLNEVACKEDVKLGDLRQVFASGEALTVDQVSLFDEVLHRQYATRLINLYGPTEATVDVSYYECNFTQVSTIIPIGKPIDNTKLYVFDKYDRLCPIGVPGELCIGGVGLARGYINDELLTSKKFIPNPFEPAGRLYRTGDLTRWSSDGTIEFLGRIDDQVKIRGNRIELGEIGHQLSAHKGIKGAVVIAKEKEGSKYLVGYYVSEEEISSTELRSYLSEHLPDYMIPSQYVRIDQIPLTSNGKIDRKRLPASEFIAGADYTAPSTDIEEKIAEIWSDILGVDKENVSTSRSFFDLGGDSIKIIVLKSRINSYFNCSFSVANMFSMPTIAALAQILGNSSEITKTNKSRIQEEGDLRDETLNLLRL